MLHPLVPVISVSSCLNLLHAAEPVGQHTRTYGKPTSDLKQDACPKAAVVPQRGVAQVTPLVRGDHRGDVQTPVRQHDDTLTLPCRCRRGDDFPPVFYPRRQNRRFDAAAVTRKYHDVARCGFHLRFGGDIPRESRCDKTRMDETQS